MADLYLSVHEIAPKLERHYGGEALTISIQDGAAAGQTVPHVHVHVLPRRPGDFEPNDKVSPCTKCVTHRESHLDDTSRTQQPYYCFRCMRSWKRCI